MNKCMQDLISRKYTNVTMDKLQMLIDNLPSERKDTVLKRYGESLDEYNQDNNEQTNYLIKRVIDSFNTYLENEKKIEDIFEKRKVSREEAAKVLPKVSSENRALLISTYGEKLDQFNDKQIFNYTYLNKALMELFRLMGKTHQNKSSNTKRTNYPILEKYYDKYPKKYVIMAINMLSASDKRIVNKIEDGELEIDKDVPFRITQEISTNLSKMYIDWGHNYYQDIRKKLNKDLEQLPKSKIDEVIAKLKGPYKKVIDKIDNKETLTKGDESYYKQTINHIANILINQRKVETIYSLFTSYTKEEIDASIGVLGDIYKKELYLRYGEDLEHPNRSSEYTKENSEFFVKSVLREIKRILDEKEYDKPKITVKINPKYIIKKTDDTPKKEEVPKIEKLTDMFSDIKLEHLRILVEILPPKCRDIIYKRHTRSLNETLYFSSGNYIELNKIYNEAILVLDKVVSIYKEPLFKMCTIDIDDFKNNINSLSDRQKEILTKVHGKNFEYTLPLCILDANEKKVYNRAIITLNHRQVIKKNSIKKSIVKKSKNETKSILIKFKDHTKEEIQEAISYLTDYRKKIIYTRFGKNLDEINTLNTPVDYSALYDAYHDIEKVFNKDENILKRKLKNKYKDYSMKQIKRAISLLNEDEQEIIYIRYGESLDEYHDSVENITNNTIQAIIKKLSVRLKEIAKNDKQFRDEMSEKYNVMFAGSISNEKIAFVIDESVEKYDENVSRERYIIKQLYGDLKGNVQNNQKNNRTL